LPRVRGRFDLERERDLEDLILSFDPDDSGFAVTQAAAKDAC
jgi:hypothetical protein